MISELIEDLSRAKVNAKFLVLDVFILIHEEERVSAFRQYFARIIIRVNCLLFDVVAPLLFHVAGEQRFSNEVVDASISWGILIVV